MTVQFNDEIYYRGESHSLCSEPLGKYLEEKGIEVHSNCSACWRGYFATWELFGAKLYLTDLKPAFVDEKDEKYLTMEYLFPNQEKVFAKWYSGELHIEEGEMLGRNEWRHPIYEINLYLIVEEGVVVDVRMVDNRGKQITDDNGDYPLFRIVSDNKEK